MVKQLAKKNLGAITKTSGRLSHSAGCVSTSIGGNDVKLVWSVPNGHPSLIMVK